MILKMRHVFDSSGILIIRPTPSWTNKPKHVDSNDALTGKPPLSVTHTGIDHQHHASSSQSPIVTTSAVGPIVTRRL